MIRPKINWNSFESRIKKLEKLARIPRRQFVITTPYKRVDKEQLERTYKKLRDEFLYVKDRDMIVEVVKFSIDYRNSDNETYEIIVHNLID